MAVFSIIPKTELEGALRLDAQCYQSKHLRTDTLINSFEYVCLEDVCTKIRKGIFDIKAETYTDGGIPFIRISDIKTGIIDDANLAFIPPEIHRKEGLTALRAGDVVLSKTAYPAAALVEMEEVNISQDIIGISLRKELKEKLVPEFLVAFLNTKYGISIMERWFQGNVQMHLALADVRRLKIPILPVEFQEEVRLLVGKSINLRKNSKFLYFEAERTVLEGLSIAEESLEDELSYVVNYSVVGKAERIDASRFQPSYRKLLFHLLENSSYSIKDIQRHNRRGVQPLFGEEGDVPVVTSSDLEVGYIDYESLDRTTSNEWKKNGSAQIKRLDVLIYTTGAHVGRACCFLSDGAALASNHINILRVEKLDPVYVSVFLGSVLGQIQVKALVRGSTQVEFYPQDIANLVVWEAPVLTQRKIADLVHQSHAARKESKLLLEEAKRKVEQEIEKGGGIR